eukprot:COSAG04_NODE_2127_length_4738_cov_3.309334_5_plen_144_part_00
MFSPEEASLLLEAGRNDRILASQAFAQEDQDGNSSKLLVWNQPVPDNNVFNCVARSERVVGAVTELLGGQEVYHWHSKLMLKEPEVGGAWEWHQGPPTHTPLRCALALTVTLTYSILADYGYWYNQGLLCKMILSRIDRALSC